MIYLTISKLMRLETQIGSLPAAISVAFAMSAIALLNCHRTLTCLRFHWIFLQFLHSGASFNAALMMLTLGAW